MYISELSGTFTRSSQQAARATTGGKYIVCDFESVRCLLRMHPYMQVCVCALELMSMGQGNPTYWHFTQTISGLVRNRGNA